MKIIQYLTNKCHDNYSYRFRILIDKRIYAHNGICLEQRCFANSCAYNYEAIK